MIAWLTDTLIYTGALIALVLVLRRPVAKHFGPLMAYSLWALPMLRFLMPPVVLPAEFAPEPSGDALAAAAPALADPAVAFLPASLDVPAPPAAPAVEFSALAPVEPAIAWDRVVLGIWLAGAAIFLAWRIWTYHRMREELLEGARPVGEVGRIRLVEAPAIRAPLAFGVSDKVIALPMEFMALEDRMARDLAIEHELAHHRGWDLLANMLAQPILALHWFNPLAWLGWRAMRRDQEAACDARVIARRAPEDRAQYGQVIASFAAGPRLALAAPMACPVLGEKSIIHRLRSLNMSDVSPRRRLAGRALLAGSALALPLTASVSYAEVPEPPAPPAAPVAMVAPVAPTAPVAPAAPDAPHFAWIADGEDGDYDVEVHEEDGKKVFVVRTAKAAGTDEDGKKVVRKVVVRGDGKMSDEQRKKLEEFHVSMAEMERDRANWAKDHEKWAKEAEKWGEEFGEKFGKDMEKWGEEFAAQWADENGDAYAFAYNVQVPDIQVGCARDARSARVESSVSAGARVKSVVVCNRNTAREAVVRARESVARDKGIEDSVRRKVLKSLDREIERLDEEG